MNILLWVLQVLAALIYTASGSMKLFMFEKISAEVPSFGAYPPAVWKALGVLELVCVVGLIVPSLLRCCPLLTVVAAATLALETILFIRGHVRYGETGSMVMSAVLGILMAFVAVGRHVLSPIG
ncbi:MAG: DoxX family protein [Planctomycetota bacterium]